MIATYALLLLCQGLVKVIWGINFLSVPPPPELAGALELGTTFVPSYVLFVISVGVLTFFGLDYLVHRTEIGKTVQSVALDPWMASILGINVQLVLIGTVALGVALAGAAGAYTTGILLARFQEVPFLLSWLAAGCMGAFVALVVAVVALRRASGIYFAILTLTLAELVHILISKSTFLGREDGLTGIKCPKLEIEEYLRI